MSLNTMSNISKHKSSLCPTNGRQTVGDGASLLFDIDASVLAVCHIEGDKGDMYYYSTTFSGGPEVGCVCAYLTPHLLLPSYSGVFDTPKHKCPPDRGSSDCVTGSSASIYATTDDNSSFSSNFHDPLTNITKPSITNNGLDYREYTRPVVYPRAIPTRSASTISTLSTPPLTPDDSDDSEVGSVVSSSSSDSNKAEEKDALDFLMNLFPNQGLQALPYAKRVSISTLNMSPAFDGVVLEFPGKPKTLYVDGKSAESVSLRESIVALLDLADERLGCSALVIVLERSSPKLGAVLHSLMYVGGTVVTKPIFPINPSYVLVGLEI